MLMPVSIQDDRLAAIFHRFHQSPFMPLATKLSAKADNQRSFASITMTRGGFSRKDGDGCLLRARPL